MRLSRRLRCLRNTIRIRPAVVCVTPVESAVLVDQQLAASELMEQQGTRVDIKGSAERRRELGRRRPVLVPFERSMR